MKKLVLSLVMGVFLYGCNSKSATTENNSESTAKKTEASGSLREDGTYSEQHRPQFHFSPPHMWMNDPNGMVYYKGEYHLFYQHYPDSTVWGPMHWGHAVSKDLVHWQNLPIALYPDSLGYIFSGSAVIDENNTAGFQKGDEKTIIAIFTHHNPKTEKQVQSLAYSTDKGRTWVKYHRNPVLPNPGISDFRDPKVSWYAPAKKWIMTLAVKDRVHFYGSADLKSWQLLSEFGKGNVGAHGGVWECPDLFPLTVEGQQKWVLFVSINPGGPNGGSATQYFIGDFNGKEFKNSNPPTTTLWVDQGADNYAGVTWSNVPAQDGRRLFMGWMSNWYYANKVPTQNWRSATTVARELTLKNTPAGIRLASAPVKELQQLRQESKTIKAQEISSPINVSQQYNLKTPLTELNLNFDVSKSAGVVLKFSNAKGEYVHIGYSVPNKQLFIDRTSAGNGNFEPRFAKKHVAPLILQNGKLNLHLFLDVASVEVFANQGQLVMTDIFFPTEDFTHLEISSQGSARLLESQAYSLESIWK
ncbi:glycoside hydrolase family 32 protein [Adhaeribacter pallidiroseus]|uniref:Fructan beta-fructosidase n=1 Tax=Adhaeribacter pallidiroseus TaxID=2072847 RepID=A0A369QI48_9BACT|nr:glycoside hydrolase family 32 protein [Adhaeribacter pallidiroseus]RDC62957.1 Fructan beta-fructosidase [Adhaeribacter pallidiroseus]